MRTCKHGHVLTKINLTKTGQCRECVNLAGRRWRRRGLGWFTTPPDECPHCHSDLTVMGAVYREPKSGRWECRQCKRNRARTYYQERKAWTATASPSTAPGKATT